MISFLIFIIWFWYEGYDILNEINENCKNYE